MLPEINYTQQKIVGAGLHGCLGFTKGKVTQISIESSLIGCMEMIWKKLLCIFFFAHIFRDFCVAGHVTIILPLYLMKRLEKKFLDLILEPEKFFKKW